MDNLLEKIRDYYRENRQLILASILSAMVIIVVIVTISFLRNDKKRTVPNNIVASKATTTENNSETESYKELSTSEETSELSDLNFTLAEEVTEETQTTLKDSEYDYMIKVNRAANCVTVYRKDSSGNFTIPHKAMACSTAAKIDNTPTGTFHTSSKYNWRLMVDGTYSQYATRIYNGILFHSVPCTSPSSDKLEYDEFNKLGSPASLGCVRLCVADAKWIYDNCSYGTVVEIYDDASNPGPLGKPSVITIPENSPYRNWDPTDPDPNNPWNKCEPSIEASDVTASVGSTLNLLSMVKATDTCGNDISSSVSIDGTVNTKKEGTYPVTYSVTDLLGRSASLKITVKIVNSSNSQVSTSSKKRSESSNTTANTESVANTIAPGSPIINTTAPYTTNQATETTSINSTTNKTTSGQKVTTANQTTTRQTSTRLTTARQTTTNQAATSQTAKPTSAATTEESPIQTTEPDTTVPDTTPEPTSYDSTSEYDSSETSQDETVSPDD